MATPNSNASVPLLQARRLCKIYRTERVETHALNEVDLEIRSGEFVSVMGASGSGKSTLLSVLGLMERASSGSLRISNIDVTDADEVERARVRRHHIGFVFQFFHLIGDLSVAENIALPMRYANAPRENIQRRVAQLTEQLGIDHRANHYPAQLSGGQQQRVAFARALANDPALLLVDEPTGNLDSKHGAQVIELLQQAHADGRAICLVTHDAAQAAVAEHRYEMRDGRMAIAA